MIRRVGICTNIGNCRIADARTKIPLGKEGICPNQKCGQKLHKVSSRSISWKHLIVIVLLIDVFVLVGFVVWNYFKPEMTQFFSQFFGDDEPPTKEPLSPIMPVSLDEAPPKEEPLPNPTENVEVKSPDRSDSFGGAPPSLKEKPQPSGAAAENAEVSKKPDSFGGAPPNLKEKPLPSGAAENAEVSFARMPDSASWAPPLSSLKPAKNADTNMPNCLSSSSLKMMKKLPMTRVPEMQGQKIPDNLQVWMQDRVHATINESAFFIMRREVTVGEFQEYVETLNSTELKKLGKTWQQENKNYPVASVPWQAAQGYADWLSKQTGCSLTLPTYNQWVAASIHSAKPKKAVIRDTQFELNLKPRKETPANVVDLLGNLREWSTEPCSNKKGHYLLGEDYKIWRVNIAGKPVCEKSTLDTVGFRLALH